MPDRQRNDKMSQSRDVDRIAARTGRLHLAAALLICLLTAGLAITSLLGDSITFDEMSHLTAGCGAVGEGDFRLKPEQPPLPTMIAALPAKLLDAADLATDTPAWQRGDVRELGWRWLYGRGVSNDILLIAGRCMIVVLLLATCLATYGLAARLFGRSAGLLALVLAGLSPTLLAHGRLVTTDVAAALAIALSLLTFARLLERISWLRLVCTALALGAMVVVKYSTLLAVPALAIMFALRLLRPGTGHSQSSQSKSGWNHRRAYLAIAGVLVITTWLSIWTCYGWRYSAAANPHDETALFPAAGIAGLAQPQTIEECWQATLHDQNGEPRQGVVPAFARFGREFKLLPESYLYGLAYMARLMADGWPGYLNGEYYHGGRWAYFPLAFAIKTPIATLLLVTVGIATLALRKVRARDSLLLMGGITFAGTYLLFSMAGSLNIGLRHLAPIYPVLFALAGAAAVWLRRRIGQVAIAGCAAWLLAANITAYPNYLSYFNEFVGGTNGGTRYLADSNIDWGQDLKRLVRYIDRHPDQQVKLSYFGQTVPQHYGVRCELLPSFVTLGESAELTAGTYVISVNQLLGIYDVAARPASWQVDVVRELYSRLYAGYGPGTTATTQPVFDGRTWSRQQYLEWAWALARVRLRDCEPDDRVGGSMFVYHLSQEEIDRLVQP